MAKIDYYKVLGISRNATEKDIKNAFRKMARKYHPDLNSDQDAKSKFQLINEANFVLSDAAKRKHYDELAHLPSDGESHNSKNSNHKWQSSKENGSYSEFNQSDSFSGFFSSIFGGNPSGGWRQTRSQKQKGRDYSFESHINLVDVFFAHKRTFNINGKNIRISVPAGVENGQTIKITGHGDAGANGGQNGDLFLTFVIAEDNTFKREGKNLFAELEIDFLTAVLGGEIIFETLNGKVKLKIKEETQNRSMIKLKNKGLPAYKTEGEQGCLQITLKVKMPQNLTETQKDLYKKLLEIS